MRNQLRWIAVSYLTRPLFLTLAGFGILFLVSTSLRSDARWISWVANYPDLPMGPVLINSQRTLDEVRARGQQKEVEAVDLDALWMDMSIQKQRAEHPNVPLSDIGIALPPESFYDVLDEFPNLRCVVYSQVAGGSRRMDQILKHVDLEYLSLKVIVGFDFSRLTPLRNLRRLDLGFGSDWRGLGRLAELPKLEMIVFHNYQAPEPGQPDQVLLDLRKLPHLKVLVLGGLRFMSSPSSYRPDVSSLAGAPSLETIYAGGRNDLQEEVLMAEIRQTLPQVTLLPALVRADWPMAMMLLGMPIIVLTLAVGVQLTVQFRGTQSRLVPGFGVSHALVGGVLGVFVIVAGARQLMLLGAWFAPAMSVSAALVSTLLITIVTNATEVRSLRHRPNRVASVMSMVFLGLAVALCIPSLGQSILYESHPWLLTVLTLIAVCAVGLTVRTMHQLVECADDPELIRGTQVNWSRVKTGQNRQLNLAAREKRIEGLASASTEWGWWMRVQRWRLGNPPIPYLRFAIVMFMMVGWSLFLKQQGRIARQTIPPQGLAIFLGMILLGASVQVGLMWRERLRILPWELQHPCSRRTWQRDLMAALVVDLLPVAVLFAVVEAVGISLDEHWHFHAESLPWSLLVFGALGCVWVMVIGTLQVVVRRRWLMVVLVMSAFIGTMTGVIGITVLRMGDHFQSNHLFTIESLWLPMVVGVVALWALQRRWLNMELAG